MFSGARTCCRLAVYQGVRVLSLTTVQEVRFAGLAILRAQPYDHIKRAKFLKSSPLYKI